VPVESSFSSRRPAAVRAGRSGRDSPVRPRADVVYLDNKTRIFFLDGDGEVQRYERAFEHIAGMALSQEESRDVLVAVLDRA
jgi:hypothetical protein